MEIVNLTYHSTNCYLISCNSGWLMIDAGWPDTMSELYKILKQNNVKISDIKYLLVTHFHPDHGGLVQDFKDSGVILILHDSQIDYPGKLNDFFKKNAKMNFKEIDEKNNMVISSSESRTFLKKLGVNGEIISTPGHSEDSITLIIDGCCAFTGDLPSLSLVEGYDDPIINSSWDLIKSYHVKTIYPAHSMSYELY